MRCPQCNSENDPGASVCASCDNPLTAYSGTLTGEASAATLAKLARLSQRPQVVPAVIALDVLFALFGPVRMLLANAAARPTTNAEGTNYAQAAFGTVGVAFMAMFLVPLALALLFLAWGAWARAAWAWWLNAGLLAAVCLGAFTGFFGASVFVRIILIAITVAAGAFWLRPEARGWYGA